MRPLIPCLLVAAILLPALLPAAVLPAATAGPAARDVALAAALKRQRLTRVEFKETDLPGIVSWLRVATGQNIVIEQHQLTKAGIDWQDLRWTVELRDVSVWTVLDDVIARPHGLAVVVRGNIVFLTSKAQAHGKPVTLLYGISHITWTKTDFIAPPINLQPSGFVEEEYEPEKVVEDDPLNNGDAVAELVKELVLPRAWQENDDWQIRATDRYLVIRAPRSVHARIPRALALIASMK